LPKLQPRRSFDASLLTADPSETAFQLPEAVPLIGVPGWRHIALGDAGSTNDLAFEAARAGDPGNLWITAKRQRAGRGRQGRQWVSERGNLYASALLVIEHADPASLGSLPLVAGLAVHEAASRAAPAIAPQLALKWPNDVLLGGRKLAGILLEGASLGAGRHAVVMGCGVNLAHAPDGTPYGATTLAAHGADVSPQAMLGHLASALASALALWNNGAGIAFITQRWRMAAAGLGGMIRVTLPDRILEGRFADIDAQGYLLLDTPDRGLMRIAAGDVFLLNTK
jgi:BirA family transcriptional regulator, biotin operon repressor / biotin---[acetyl-CoA-carboxylase] ligase